MRINAGVVVLGLVLMTQTARAQEGGVLLSAPPGAFIDAARFAVAVSPTRRTEWLSVQVQLEATTKAFAWIIPVRSDAQLDTVSDAWFTALAGATDPRVVPSAATSPTCNAMGEVADMSSWWPPSSVPSQVIVAEGATHLAGALAPLGLIVPDVDPEDTTTYAAMVYVSPSGYVTTRTLRIVDGGGSVLPLYSIPAGIPAGQTLDITAYAITAGTSAIGDPSQELTISPAHVSWYADNNSSYDTDALAATEGSPGAWLVQTRGHSPLFDATATGVGPDVASLATQYFAAAEPGGPSCDASPAAASSALPVCAVSAAAASSALPLAAVCPAALLANPSSAPPCSAGALATETPPASFACGSSDDLALALAGISPVKASITRAVVEAPQTGAQTIDSLIAPSSSPSFGPVVVATQDSVTCGSGPTTSATSASGCSVAANRSASPLSCCFLSLVAAAALLRRRQRARDGQVRSAHQRPVPEVGPPLGPRVCVAGGGRRNRRSWALAAAPWVFALLVGCVGDPSLASTRSQIIYTVCQGLIACTAKEDAGVSMTQDSCDDSFTSPTAPDPQLPNGEGPAPGPCSQDQVDACLAAIQDESCPTLFAITPSASTLPAACSCY